MLEGSWLASREEIKIRGLGSLEINITVKGLGFQEFGIYEAQVLLSPFTFHWVWICKNLLRDRVRWPTGWHRQPCIGQRGRPNLMKRLGFFLNQPRGSKYPIINQVLGKCSTEFGQVYDY